MHRNKRGKKIKPRQGIATAALHNLRSALLGFIWKSRSRMQKAAIITLAFVSLILLGSYSIAYWYQQRHKHEPLQIGTTFVPDYARLFGLDPKEVMQAGISDLGFNRFRLVSYWKNIEKEPGKYDYGELDWQFRMAEENDVKISLALGLRQPRWPECHMPVWAENLPESQWKPELMKFIAATVERYKDSPALESYQLENEYFMTVFGICTDFERERFIEEFKLVKRIDPDKPVVITRSNNWGGVPIGEPTPDIYGVAVYKRVFDYTVTKRYFEYPYPPWFYALLAGAGEIVSGKPLIVHELQTEPWLPEDYAINDKGSIPEQNKSMNADRLKSRIQYGKDTGLRTIDTWGFEWWYWRKVKANDPSLWDVAKEEISKANQENALSNSQ